jgi:hypothetical protein
MPRYLITLKEITYQEVIVEANSLEEAKEKGYEAQFEPDFGWDGNTTTMVDSIEQVEDNYSQDIDNTNIIQEDAQ